MRYILSIVFSIVLFAGIGAPVSAQTTNRTPNTLLPEFLSQEVDEELASEAAQIASPSAEEQEEIDRLKEEDVTRPEENERRSEVLVLFTQRPADDLTLLNGIAYGVQFAVRSGVPANTIMLILLLPILATLYAFLRHVIGIPSIGMFLPVALSITLVATGITTGIILLGAILFSSTMTRILFKRVRIMHLPKVAISMLFVSMFIIATLTVSSIMGLVSVRQLSIFPVLLLILLSEQIIAIQLERTIQETFVITSMTIFLGVLGYTILSSTVIRNTVLLYPELIFILIPLNLVIGRYFGLRISEFFRFSTISNKP